MDKTVSILMATYNGERYLVEQLESILCQSYTNWQLYIRDDLSSDGTISIIDKYCKIDSRITLLDIGDQHGSACKNFSELLKWATISQKQYIMFCDQDDIWLPNKIMETLAMMLKQELTGAENEPLLVYSKFQYIDVSGISVDKEFKIQKLPNVANLLCDNYVYGCTSMINLPLAKLSTPIPQEAVNHDYWIALTASCFGKIYFLDKTLIKYRQHNSNVSGNINKAKLFSRLSRFILVRQKMYLTFKSNIEMYKSFFRNFKDQMTLEQNSLFTGYFLNLKKSDLTFVKFLIRNKIYKADLLRTLTFLYSIGRLRKSLASIIETT